MEKMKQDDSSYIRAYTKNKSYTGYFVCGSADIAVPVWHVWKFARRASSAWGGSRGCPFVSRESAGGVSA
jgi:hypothetical protein